MSVPKEFNVSYSLIRIEPDILLEIITELNYVTDLQQLRSIYKKTIVLYIHYISYTLIHNLIFLKTTCNKILCY